MSEGILGALLYHDSNESIYFMNNKCLYKTKSLPTAHAGARFFCQLIEEARNDAFSPTKILVAGCGHGQEALYIRERLNIQVEAVDIWLDRGIELPKRENLHFHECNILKLPFEDTSFDSIFYHHVIEHVNAPGESLAELSRLLKTNGFLFIGTPNRHRLIGNLGAHEQSIKHKISQNVNDWKLRLQGKFRNELGAHAGFSQNELNSLLQKYYDEQLWITKEYLRFKYKRGIRHWLARLCTTKPLIDITAPSIYAWCTKH